MPGHRASRAFREIECKLDAPSLTALRKVGDFIQREGEHYVTRMDARFLPPVMDGFKGLGAPHGVTGLRVRTYYDDLKLRGHARDFEIRLEQDEKSGRWKQTIKIGATRADRNGLFHRQEKAYPLPGPSPDLTLLSAKEQKRLCAIYDVNKVSDIVLLPLVQLYSQRMTVEYHPDGNRNRLIEYAQATVRGQTCTGYVWDFYQAELEIKKGGSNILPKEADRLKDEFNFLRTGSGSKPSLGFDKLQEQLQDKDDRKYLRDRLQPGPFRVVKSVRFQP